MATFWCRIIQNPFDTHADFGDAGPSPASWLVDDNRIVATHLNRDRPDAHTGRSQLMGSLRGFERDRSAHRSRSAMGSGGLCVLLRGYSSWAA